LGLNVHEHLIYVARDTTGAVISYIDTDNFTAVINTWYHVAITKDSTTTKLYVDGIKKKEVTNTGNGTVLNSSIPVMIGNYWDTDLINPALFGFEGYMDNARITKGAVLWENDFNLTDDALLYLAPDVNPNRSDILSSLYNIGIRGNIRGKAKAGFIRPTLKQFFTSTPNFENVPN